MVSPYNEPFLSKLGCGYDQILMSATLDSALFSHYFNDCPVIQVPGFTYPVRDFSLQPEDGSWSQIVFMLLCLSKIYLHIFGFHGHDHKHLVLLFHPVLVILLLDFLVVLLQPPHSVH
jgi:hypothetical protein